MNTPSAAVVLAVCVATCWSPVAAGARAAGGGRPSSGLARLDRATPGRLGAPASEQTHAVVRPTRGRPATRFVLALTARLRLGATDGMRADYRVTVEVAGGGCAVDFTISAAAAGAHLREPLRPPRRSGWCQGGYTGVVTLDRAPACGPSPGGRPVACPDFVLAPVTVGRFSFTVV